LKADLGHRPRRAAAETRLEEDADAGVFASLKQTRLSAEVLRTEADPVERSNGFMLSGQWRKNTAKKKTKRDVHPEYRRMSCRKPCRRLCLMEPFMGKAPCPDGFACVAIHAGGGERDGGFEFRHSPEEQSGHHRLQHRTCCSQSRTSDHKKRLLFLAVYDKTYDKDETPCCSLCRYRHQLVA